MSSRVRVFPVVSGFLSFVFFAMPTVLGAADSVWDAPTFSASQEALRLAAAAIKADKDADATMFLNHIQFTFDAQGREVETWHRIYRIENEEGVKNWAEVSGSWEPWHQSKPEIKARVLAPDGIVHQLDLKTLNDVPVHEDEPDLYSDARRYGGPLPAISPGAIVEEEITTRDTSVFFAGGLVERRVLVKNIPVTKTRFVIAHPETLPLHYVVHLLPAATVGKSVENGVETITIENGPLEAFTDDTTFLPPDVLHYPEVEFSTGTSWQQVAVEYARLVNDKLRLADVQPLLARANAVNSKDASRQEVVRRLVSALHKSVRYTGVEFGESSLAPQFPAETLKRKYGDCKDKATLLAAMLQGAGIPAKIALLSTGPGQDVNTDLPGMGEFDHAIVYVPATASDPELWIDATAQYSRVGVLPEMDYGRWALVIDEKTTALKKIPELTSAQNVHRETREFTLAEYGPARIVETNSQEGPMEADYRDFYTGDPKKLRENSEKYVKDAYLADSLISLEKGDASDLNKPFTVTYTAKGRRGFSDRENAVVYIYPAALISGLPDYFETEEEKRKDDAADKDKEDATPKKPRKFDWQFNPFMNEWHYKIIAPAGFKLRALPANKEEQLGSAHCSQTFTANPEGTVAEAVLRFDTGKARLTVEEGKKLRDAIVKAREADAIVITFDQIGHALLNQGKVRDSLAAYQQLTALHPKEALHRIQLAYAYLSAGLGDRARAVAKEATILEPNSADAFSTLGWIMEHDLIGRRFAKGFDYQAAVEAYRKARQLDPNEKDPRDKGAQLDYAMLLEYDADGVRYGEKSHMEQAIAEFRDVKKRDEATGKKYDDFVLYDLWYLRRFKELQEELATLPASDIRKAFILGAIAAQEGSDAAIKRSLQITSEESDRSKVLVTAAYLLLRLRKYPEAAELYASGAHGQKESGALLAFAESLRKTKSYDQLKFPDSDPRSVVQQATIYSVQGTFDAEKNLKIYSGKILELYEKKTLADELRDSFNTFRKKIEATQIPVEVSLDIALSNTRYNVEGDDNVGYRVTVQAPNAQPMHFFLAREDGKNRIMNVLSPLDLAREALERLEKNDLPGARKWLDWARESVRMGGGDDPLEGIIFPRFWTKGQQADANTIRIAALSALSFTKYVGPKIPELVQARDNAREPAVRNSLNLALAAAYQSQKRWPELLAVSEELMKAYPESYRAYQIAATACVGSKNFELWEKLLQARLQQHPDEPEYVRAQARLEMFRGEISKSRATLKSLIDGGKANDSDLNGYAWYALLPPSTLDADAVDAAERANSLSKNAHFGIMHTLACVYAQQGKTKQARDLLLKAMDVASLPEPNSSVWLALAEIAEQYGEVDAARTMYARVEKEEIEVPASNYALAQLRLQALKNPSATAARNAGK